MKQQARAYNGYRVSYRSPYASVTINRGMYPMRVLYGVIGANVAVFVLWQLNPGFAARHFMVSPQYVREGRVYTLLTSAFSHAELTHLAVNMITLYFFGQEVALTLGPRLFLTLYCTAGIAASLAHVGWYWYKAVRDGGPPWVKDARLRMAPPALGASGAVSAVVISGVLLAPMRMVLVFPIPIPMPAFMLGVLWIASDISGSIKGEGTVGHVAHLGGAATGLAFYWAWRRGLLRRRF